MLLSLKWLKEFTPYTGDTKELAHVLTMLGLEVEEIFNPFEEIKEVVVGHVVECDPHPNADKLKICKVDIGRGEAVDIICGAPNVSKGQYVPVAPVGSTLPGNFVIKKAKIRGKYSYGMICSEKELGLSEDHSGIMVIDGNPRPGDKLIDFLDLDTTVFDIGMTPNRADCLSVLGIAREVAAYFELPLNMPKSDLEGLEAEETCKVDIVIEDGEDCPLYMARIIEEIKIAPSPAWMRYRLLSMGVRAINNVVDITNYVLLELGHPLHGFDRDLLRGNTIRIARPSKELEIKTLDGQERRVGNDDLLIWDAEVPVALAGIMGGYYSEINKTTQNVLLECAVFNPSRIRRSARRLGLSTEASYRFERGVDQLGAERAINRATYLIHRFAGGKILKGVAKKEPKKWTPRSIIFRPQRSKKLLAVDIDTNYSINVLKKLGCEIREIKSLEEYRIIPPSYRLDLEREIDLIEEVGRFYGLEKIPATLPRVARPLKGKKDSKAGYDFLFKIKEWARGMGLQEAVTYSFVGKNELLAFGEKEDYLIPIQNPLASDQDTMRSLVIAGLLNSLKTNLDRLNRDLRFFEVARTFTRDPKEETGVKEKNKLAIVVEGRRYPRNWTNPSREWDFFDIKALVDHLFSTLEIGDPEYREAKTLSFLERGALVFIGEKPIGFIGNLSPSLAKEYHGRGNIWLCELDLDEVFKLYGKEGKNFKPWSKFPPVYRDMTVVCPPQVRFEDILKCLKESKVSLLEDTSLIDVYVPEKGRERNLTLRMTYRHANKNLTDKEVDKVHQRLGKLLLEKLPVRFP